MHLKLLQKEEFKKQKKQLVIGNKSANKITKKSPQNTSETVENEIGMRKGRYISSDQRQKIIDGLRLM